MMIEILIINHGMIQAIISIIGKRFGKWTGLETWRYNRKSLMVDFLGIVSWPPSCGDYEIGGESPQIVGTLGWALHVFYWVSMESQQLHTAPSSP